VVNIRPVIHIRPEEPADHGAIRAVQSVSFPTLGEARLVDALRAGGRLRVSLVAVEQGQVIGHVAFSPVTVGGHH
jgi:putative acetyltransferase